MKTIVLIPYRNRGEHLKYFLDNTAPKLKKQINNLEILIVEQSDDNKLFNRGKLLNVGFQYCNNDNFFYINHDVDLYPKNEILNKYSIENENNFLSIVSAHNLSLGGIIKFKGKLFRKINGFRNDIWGWGNEDRDLYYRSKFKGIKCDRIIEKLIQGGKFRKNFSTIKHKSNENQLNKKLRKKIESIYNSCNNDMINKFINESGLNNLEFVVLNEEVINDYIKRIKVNI